MQEQSAFEGGVNRPDGKLDIEATNILQVKLIKLSGQDPEAWIEQYSAAFRDVIDEELDYFSNKYQPNDETPFKKEFLLELQKKLDARVLH